MSLEELIARNNALLEQILERMDAPAPKQQEDNGLTPNTLLSQHRAATYCGISDQRLLRYRKRGEINAVVKARTPLYAVKDLDRLCARYGLKAAI